MASITVKTEIKYRVVRNNGNKEIEQHFETFNQTIELSEANFTLLKAAISGLIDAEDGNV